MSHWYDNEGNPRHFEGKNGKGTTLREARKLTLYPSVTTIGQVVAKFALTNWLQEEAAMMAAEKLEGYGEEWVCPLDRTWAKTVVAASREKTMAKADEGSAIHDALEKYYTNQLDTKHPMHKGCYAVYKLIEDKCGIMWSNAILEKSFCNLEHGYAGRCDLHAYVALQEDTTWVIDFKTKDTVDDKTRGWPEQAEQLAAYAHGLGIPDARLANVFISREDPTQVVWFEHKDPMAWERFRHTLMLWSVSKKFGPYYEQLIRER